MATRLFRNAKVAERFKAEKVLPAPILDDENIITLLFSSSGFMKLIFVRKIRNASVRGSRPFSWTLTSDVPFLGLVNGISAKNGMERLFSISPLLRTLESKVNISKKIIVGSMNPIAIPKPTFLSLLGAIGAGEPLAGSMTRIFSSVIA